MAIDNPVTSDQLGMSITSAEVSPISSGQLAAQQNSLGAGLALLPEIHEWRGKRALDICLALLLFVVLAPVAMLAALAIWLEAPRSRVLVRQLKVGCGGREFWMLKFGSMQPDAEECLHAREDLLVEHFYNGDHKIPGHLDPRITSTGRFLRRSSIDEIPQLVNVLAGHMSLVGPRPVECTQPGQYESRKVFYLSMRPGLTGLWQVGSVARLPSRSAPSWMSSTPAAVLSHGPQNLDADPVRCAQGSERGLSPTPCVNDPELAMTSKST
jgi:lipopolysaccharide/colanic/teichoic acid biosynthesis glycosyltransferase